LDIEERLKQLGFASVDVAATEAQAIALAHQRCPNLITADVHLYEGSGIAAVQTICSKYAKIPVIYITSARELVHGVPPELIIGKPFFPGEIERAYRAALQQLCVADD
jgi:CheY-like chemotaxis protein